MCLECVPRLESADLCEFRVIERKKSKKGKSNKRKRTEGETFETFEIDFRVFRPGTLWLRDNKRKREK